jgi:hypothetical protein
VPGLLLGLGEITRGADDQGTHLRVRVGVALEQLLDRLGVVEPACGARRLHPPGEGEVVAGGLLEGGEVLGGHGVGSQRLECAAAQLRAGGQHRGAVGDLVAAFEDLVDRGVPAGDQPGQPEERLHDTSDLLALQHTEDAGQGVLGAELAPDEHVVGSGHGQRPRERVGQPPGLRQQQLQRCRVGPHGREGQVVVVDQAQVGLGQVDRGLLARGAHRDVAHVTQRVAVDGVAADVEAMGARALAVGGAARPPGRPPGSRCRCRPGRASPSASR